MILITGGSGYLARHFLHLLRDSDIQQVSFDRRPPLQAEEGNFLLGSIEDINLVKSIFKNQTISAVVHLAAHKQLINSTSVDDPYFSTNIAGTKNLLTAMSAYGAPPIIFASSAAVYSPKTVDESILESDETTPLSLYGRSKLHSERDISEYTQSTGATSFSLRFFNIGGSASPELYDTLGTNIFPTAIRKLAQNEKFDLYGGKLSTPDGTPIRDYLHVLDAANAILKSLLFLKSNSQSRTHHILNVGTGKGTSVLEILKMIENFASRNFDINFLGPRKGEVQSVVSNPALIEDLLGWSAQYSVSDLIKSDVQNSGFFI
jgi:UDP-glucose 4-epimerase